MNLHCFKYIALAASMWLSACAGMKLDDDQQALVHSAEQAGATALEAHKTDDGGLRLNGELEGRAFALSIPWRWNRQAVLFTTGYSPPGTPTHIPDNVLANDIWGFLRAPYAERFAVGRSAYDKSGMAVQSAVVNTYRLKQFLDKLGATRVYIIGGSMGGSIAMALIEKHPDDFAGAIAACGVVGDWTAELGSVIDVRAAYEYFTRGTPYALPGEQSIAKSELSTLTWGPLDWIWPLPSLIQIKRMVSPVLKLFDAAAKNPQGPEQRMLDNIAAAAHTQPDPASFLLPLATVGLGMDDIVATYGGQIYDNSAKVYSSPNLSAQENAALNAGIQRIHADPAALANAAQWYKTTGHYKAKLLSIYNSIDPEVSSEVEQPMLLEATQQAGNLDNLVQRAMPPERKKVFPGMDVVGYAHCGFTPDQSVQAWDDLRGWVETGKKP
ncbi:MAG TPA: alpha/beta fold hydrolase [Nevskia sp.]|nr:alpha/beta fold hydrolase [Nevskia sp.]